MAVIKVYTEAELNKTQEPTQEFSEKDWSTVRAMLKYARSAPQHNLKDISLTQITRKSKLALVMMPPWGTFFPPYNLARLSSLTKLSGYETRVYDVNVKAWNHLKNNYEYDLWDHSKEWMWSGASYIKNIHPQLEELFNKYLDEIVEYKPDVVGFSAYYTNETSINWFALYLKRKLPGVKIVVGGPQALGLGPILLKTADYVVQGEGEQIILDLLDNIDNSVQPPNKIIKASKERLNLDGLPFPDYSHFNLNEYLIPNGISSEFSRGCVAKCVFCTETHFWKYRGRMSSSVLDELKHQYETHGSDFVWFIDSLLNGNINELRAFALGMIELNLPIKWTGYARCDGRMDQGYFDDLAAAGCHMLSFGVESGSQRVLDHMKKMTTVQDIEQNFIDSHRVGIAVASTWIVGFPSEDPQCFAETLTLVSRLSPYHNAESNYGVGVSLALSLGSEIADNPENFDIFADDFEGSWTNNSMTNTRLHRLIRQKSIDIYLNELSKVSEFKLRGADIVNLRKTYNFKQDDPNSLKRDIEYDQFDYNIIKPNINPFTNSVVNEIWPLLRSLWKTFGNYQINVVFDPEVDSLCFGSRLSCNYSANYDFKIVDGVWSAEFTFRFSQQSKFHQDYSFDYSWAGQGHWS